jgi:uncharacterized membrane protein YphA (DoxX/SURF4 family)
MTGWITWRGHAWLGLAARLYLGGVFLLACVHKILHPEAFAVDVATYRFLPLWAINFFALTLPWVELAAGLLLVLGVRARAASLLVALMMLAFLVALGSALSRGLELSCGCFASQGAEADPISWRTLVRDLAWLALSLYVLVLDRAPLGLERWLDQRRARST